MVKKKATQIKKKKWRKQLDDAPAIEAATQIYADKKAKANDALFTLDTVGDLSVQQKIKQYPDKFASVKKILPPTKTSIKQTEKYAKKPATKASNKSGSQMFDLWVNAEAQSRTVKSENAHIPAVLPPVNGVSYRPTEDAHNNILQRVIEEEVAKDVKSQETQQYLHNYKIIEEDVSVSESSDEEEEISEPKKNPRVDSSKKLTKTERNIQMRKKLHTLLRKKEAEERKALKLIDQAPRIAKELAKEEKIREQFRARKRQRDEEKLEDEKLGLLTPKVRLGNFHYHEPDTAAPISVSQNLRNLKVKGGGAEERLDMLIRRKMVDMSTGKPSRTKYLVKERLSGRESREKQKGAKKSEEMRKEGNLSI
jgi:hypothetical protein